MAQNDDSILNSVKHALGLDEDYKVFDPDVLMHINTVFSTLNQLGAGPAYALYVSDESTTWADFIGSDQNIQNVKTYMYLRVRLLFDPPTTSFGLDSIKEQIKEFEWRINIEVDTLKNPNAPIQVSEAEIFDLTGGLDFPAEAETGDFGLDMADGNIYKDE